mgnify:CR=1 FL=1
MKHQDVHNDWFMWTKVRNVMRTFKYCNNICLRISRAVAVTKLCTKLWNARISNEVQHVENRRIFSSNLIVFKIDLRKLWSQRPVWSFRRAHRRPRWKSTWSSNPQKRSQFKVLSHLEPQFYSGEIPILSDIIHVSGGDAERDFEDDHLALSSSHGRPWTRLIYQWFTSTQGI